MTTTSPTYAGMSTPPARGSRFWVERAAHGFIAGAAIATLDFLYYLPIFSGPNGLGPGLFAASLIVWCGECVLFALALGFAERLASPAELRAWQVVLALVAGVTAAVIVWHAFAILVLRDELGLRLFRDHVAQPDNWLGGMLYHLWLMLFCGGLIASVMASRRRRTRMLSVLRSAELRRATAQQRLAEARLSALEAHIDPDRVYDTLSRLERLYDEDPRAADQLLDELIAFLRGALAETRVTREKERP